MPIQSNYSSAVHNGRRHCIRAGSRFQIRTFGNRFVKSQGAFR